MLRMTYHSTLQFFYGESIDWPLFFKEFSFVVSAGSFAGFGAGGGEKFNFLKFLTIVGYQLFYLLKIISVVGSNS